MDEKINDLWNVLDVYITQIRQTFSKEVTFNFDLLPHALEISRINFDP